LERPRPRRPVRRRVSELEKLRIPNAADSGTSPIEIGLLLSRAGIYNLPAAKLATLTKELVHGRCFRTHEEARLAVFEWIEV